MKMYSFQVKIGNWSDGKELNLVFVEFKYTTNISSITYDFVTLYWKFYQIRLACFSDTINSPLGEEVALINNEINLFILSDSYLPQVCNRNKTKLIVILFQPNTTH